MNEAQKKTFEDLSRATGKTLSWGPIEGWVHPLRRGELQVKSDTGIRVALNSDGTVADIDLGSFLQSSAPDGNESPANRFRVAVLALTYSGRTFDEICRAAGGSKVKFDVGWMPTSPASS